MNPLNHQALVHYVARKWLKSFEKAAVSIDYNDLVQEAFMVFIYASKKFDPTKGWAFSTYFNVASNHHFHNMLTRLMEQRTLSVEVNDDFSILDLIEDEGENPELEFEAWERVETAIKELSPVAKMMAELLLSPPKEVKEQFAAVEAKRKVASSMGIDERYPPELNLNFVASIMAVTGVAASDLSKAKEEVKRLELDYAV